MSLIYLWTVSRDRYFLRSKHLISTFCVCADSFQGLSKAFHYPIQLLTFYLFLWNYLPNFENAYWNPPQNSPLCDWSMSLPPTSHWLQGNCARINLSQAASCMILQNHRWLLVSIFSVRIASLGSLKWVTGSIFKISK